MPLVKSGAVVCADRYAYTAFARDVARGVSRRWVRNLYRSPYVRTWRSTSACRWKWPSAAFWVAQRHQVLRSRDGSRAQPRRGGELPIFQGRILDEYEAMIQEVGFHVIDATGSIEEQQQQMREIVMRELGDSLVTGFMRASPETWMLLKQPLGFYSESLAGVDRDELQGKLIVIEGPDSVGRSTQVARLRTWLEHQGHAVLDTGMARGALAGKGSSGPRRATRWARSR